MSTRHRFGGKITPPPTGPFLAAFVDNHRGDPWHGRGRLWAQHTPPVADDGVGTFLGGPGWMPPIGEVRAGMLYDRYADEAEAARAAGTLGYEPIMSHRDFGLALQALGFESKRDSDGNRYPGLTYETRAERADTEARARVGVKCGHTEPLPIPGLGTLDVPIWHACPDLPPAVEARVQAIIEAEYRPLLDWHVGEPEPYREPPKDD